MKVKTRKNEPWSGWKKINPSTHQRTVMLQKCGKKCFLGPNKSFPICAKNTCTISNKGLYAAYVRARQYSKKGSKYRKIASKSKNMLTRRNIKR